MSSAAPAEIVKECYDAIFDYDEAKVAALLGQYPALANAVYQEQPMLLYAVHASQCLNDAQQESSYHITRDLLRAGADPHSAIPDWARASNDGSNSLLHLAVGWGALPAIRALLEDGRIDREERVKNNTPLLRAVKAMLERADDSDKAEVSQRQKYLSIIQQLAPFCDPDARDADGKFALELLLSEIAPAYRNYVREEAAAAFEVLINAGADVDMPARISGKDGMPLLNPLSVNQLPPESLKTLLLAGASQDVFDAEFGGTARNIFSQKKPTDCAGKPYHEAGQELAEKAKALISGIDPIDDHLFVKRQAPSDQTTNTSPVQPRLTPLIKALAQFDLLENFFTRSDPQRFGGYKQRIQYAERVQALLPPTRADKTGLLILKRDHPLDRPGTCALVQYTQGSIAEIKR